MAISSLPDPEAPILGHLPRNRCTERVARARWTPWTCGCLEPFLRQAWAHDWNPCSWQMPRIMVSQNDFFFLPGFIGDLYMDSIGIG